MYVRCANEHIKVSNGFSNILFLFFVCVCVSHIEKHFKSVLNTTVHIGVFVFHMDLYVVVVSFLYLEGNKIENNCLYTTKTIEKQNNNTKRIRK